jgi:hypothetical protein
MSIAITGPHRHRQQTETRTGVTHIATFAIVVATALLAILGGAVLNAQGQGTDKYSLKSPDGIAFADLRG